MSSLLRTTSLAPAIAATIALLIFQSCSSIEHKLGGAFRYEPEELEDHISDSARLLIEKSFEDLGGYSLIDYHTHMLGLGTDCKDCFVHPASYDFFSPLRRFRFNIYMSASGIGNPKRADQEYLDRLVRLIRGTNYPMKSALLAFDKHHNLDGSEDLEKTEFYVPNSIVFELSERYPDIFIPVISVHPYRVDAIEELDMWGRKGVRMVKWLPNAMGIDPSHPRVSEFYSTMKRYDMILLSHTGDEKAVHAEEDQKLGNPLLLRTALNYGVKVIMAHSASLGTCDDLDSLDNGKVPCFDLFLKMMEEERYDGLLYGEISAMLQYNRMPTPIQEILRRPELHPRLVNGSDYPLVAVNVLIRTSELAEGGFITEQERKDLNEIYDFNPLLFDFVLKRTINLPGTAKKLPPSVFTRNLFRK